MFTRVLAIVGLVASNLIIQTSAHAKEPTSESDISIEETRSWQPGHPLPDGYRAVRKRTLGILGISLLGGGYALSVISGFGILASCHIPAGEGSGSACYQSISDTCGAWLLLPIVGPFAALGRSDVQKDEGAVFWFATFGAMQVAGAGLLTYYWAKPKYRLERTDTARLIVLPVVNQHVKGLLLSGRF